MQQPLRVSPDSSYERPAIDDGYASQDSRSCSHNSTMKESYLGHIKSDSPPHTSHRQCSNESQCLHLYHPAARSPSASSIEDFEIMLREKERELSLLRDTMEANEKVIFQVNEEKRVSWENQMKDLTAEYHRRLQLQQDRTFKMEEELKEKIAVLQNDNQKLMAERDRLLSQRDRNSYFKEQVNLSRQKSNDLSNQLTQAICEAELLKQQTAEKEAQLQRLEEEMTVIKAENMNLSNELDDRRRSIKKLDQQESASSTTAAATESEIKRLQIIISEKEALVNSEQEKFDAERHSWEQEKRKVLQYQRQLQSNYMQMCRRNSELESDFYQTHSENANNNNQNMNRSDRESFKAQLELKTESLC